MDSMRMTLFPSSWHLNLLALRQHGALWSQCSGLKINVDKSKAVWLGSKPFRKGNILYCFQQNTLALLFNEPFDILGIKFFVETQ